MTLIQEAIINELSLYMTKLAPELYLYVGATFFREHNQKPNELGIHISPASGGAWKHIGLIVVEQDQTTITLVTVNGITHHTGQKETRTYPHCDPAYPQNLQELIIKAAHNANKAHKIANERSWNHHNRRFRHLYT